MFGKTMYCVATVAVFFNVPLMVIGDETTTIPGESLCYNCGYMEKADGSMSKIPDQVEDIPFCGENFLNDTLDAPTKALMIVRNEKIFLVYSIPS
jgi:hypothetical protein